METPRRRRVRGLFLSWIAYWVIAAGIKFGPAALAIYRATRGPADDKSTVGVNVTNWVISLLVTDHGRTTWAGSVHVVALALWIAGVPLLLWMVWLFAQPAGASQSSAERQRV